MNPAAGQQKVSQTWAQRFKDSSASTAPPGTNVAQTDLGSSQTRAPDSTQDKKRFEEQITFIKLVDLKLLIRIDPLNQKLVDWGELESNYEHDWRNIGHAYLRQPDSQGPNALQSIVQSNEEEEEASSIRPGIYSWSNVGSLSISGK